MGENLDLNTTSRLNFTQMYMYMYMYMCMCINQMQHYPQDQFLPT